MAYLFSTFIFSRLLSDILSSLLLAVRYIRTFKLSIIQFCQDKSICTQNLRRGKNVFCCTSCNLSETSVLQKACLFVVCGGNKICGWYQHLTLTSMFVGARGKLKESRHLSVICVFTLVYDKSAALSRHVCGRCCAARVAAARFHTNDNRTFQLHTDLT